MFSVHAWRGDRGTSTGLTVYSLKGREGRDLSEPEVPKDDNYRRPYHPVPPRNVHETLDVRGVFSISTQVPHGHLRRSRMGNHHRDDVTVFRFEVFDHHVDVHDIRVRSPRNVLPGRFVAAAEFQVSFNKHGFRVRQFGGTSPEIETEGIYGELLSQLLLVNVVFMTDSRSKCVLRVGDEGSEVPQGAMEDLESKVHSAPTHTISEELD
jgi:hypothetical protein